MQSATHSILFNNQEVCFLGFSGAYFTECSDGAEAKLAANISGPASGLELSRKETGGVGREKKVEDLRRG